MSAPEAKSPTAMRGFVRIDFWSIVMAVSLSVIGLMLIWPIAQVLILGFSIPRHRPSRSTTT